MLGHFIIYGIQLNFTTKNCKKNYIHSKLSINRIDITYLSIYLLFMRKFFIFIQRVKKHRIYDKNFPTMVKIQNNSRIF